MSTPQPVTHRETSVEVSIDGRRHRARVVVASRGDLALAIGGASLVSLPPRLPFEIDRETATDAEIIA